jgi:ParB family chromosome partitioning protein
MTRQRALGRGLAELIPAAGPPRDGERVEQIAVALIDPNPYQPRRDFDETELAELTASIRAQGLLQPVTLRRHAERYQLVAGERRLRAVRDLGWTHISAIVREVDDRQLLELSLVENLLRTDLNEIEVAQAFRNLEDLYGYTATQLAEVTGKSRPAVSNTLRLLELSEQSQELIRSRTLTAGHGRALLSFPPPQREELAEQAAREGWSVRELERRASELLQRKPVRRARRKKPAAIPSSPSALKRAETQLTEFLGTKVRVAENNGKGTITVRYFGADDLKRVLDLLLRSASPF